MPENRRRDDDDVFELLRPLSASCTAPAERLMHSLHRPAVTRDVQTPEELEELLREVTLTGMPTLPPGAFEVYAGRLCACMEARPYLRARAGLAEALWAAGRREEAVGRWRELLRLNTWDDQGVLYCLALGLYVLGEDRDLQRLLDRFSQDDSSQWAYTRALWRFRRRGPRDPKPAPPDPLRLRSCIPPSGDGYQRGAATPARAVS